MIAIAERSFQEWVKPILDTFTKEEISKFKIVYEHAYFVGAHEEFLNNIKKGEEKNDELN